jgi:hypothetical protein
VFKTTSTRVFILAIFVIFFALPSNILAQKINWQPATAYVKDGSVLTGKLKSKKKNFWYYLILKTDENPKTYLYPEEVDEVICKDYRFISFKYVQEDFKHSTYSFAHVIAGDSVSLIYTRYSKWVCNCSKGERYFWGWFITSHEEFVLLDIKKDKLLNSNEVYDFIINHKIYCSPNQVSTIEGIKQVLENI